MEPTEERLLGTLLMVVGYVIESVLGEPAGSERLARIQALIVPSSWTRIRRYSM